MLTQISIEITMKISQLHFLYLVVFLSFSCKDHTANTIEASNTLNSTKLIGEVFGTSYSIIYDSDTDFQKAIDSVFKRINHSMSTYQVDSDISRINRNEDVAVDQNFKRVFEASKVIYKETNGAFDPTIGAVVNAWDFGPEGRIVSLDSTKIDSLMSDVGFNKISINNDFVKKNKGTFIDFNAIAKGYGVDAVGEFLESQNIDNYLVEIGGEIRVKGRNIEKDAEWKVGIEEPHFDGERSIFKTLELIDESMATSGVYRKFKVDEDGNRYSHIIDTETGYPSKSNILSISVIAKTCMYADGYATAFKSMGIAKVEEFLKNHPELKVYIIYDDGNGKFATLSLNGFPNQ
ncbi:thiamine biosynthesis lipoprotein [Flavobacteriaceae bacterium MAR_2010_188]|nr:thiamine biosynthesis lipoprotein [Flavobacteriaceae bacterium MAR_2010_188]